MASNEKQVKVKIATEEELSGVEALELKLQKLNAQKIQLGIDIASQKLEETQSKIDELKQQKANLEVGVDDSKIKEIDSEIAQLEQESVNLQIEIETGKLKQAESEVENLDGTTIDIDVNNISAMEAVDQIGQGFDRLKQGASEVGQAMGGVLESAGRMENTETFLKMNLGADEAKTKLEQIRNVTDTLPGDDVVLQNLLSQAAIQDVTLADKEFQQMGSTAADYMAAMENYGKSSKETQQDLMNYILAGNTAELEGSPILQGKIDKLKEANTVRERSQALEDAINEAHWGGISDQDTYNNKLQKFNDMLERGKMTMGDMFLDASKGAMDWALQLDDASNGLVGMTIAAAGFASPVADSLMGLSQMATGMKAIKDLGMIQWFKDLQIMTKLSAAADWLLSGAQTVLNFVMSMNPIVLVVIALIALAAALIWAYQNVDWFREMVDNAWASLVELGQQIYGVVSGAIQWLGSLFNQFTNQLGLNTNDWMQAILGFILFIPQLPLQIGIALVNALAKVLGFGNNFVQRLQTAASNAVNGFIDKIRQLPGMIQSEFARIQSIVSSFVTSLPSRVWDLGASIVGALKSALGIGSPGHMFYMFEGELIRLRNLPRTMSTDINQQVSDLGSGMVDAFDGTSFDVSNRSLIDSFNTSQDKMGQVINLTIEVGSVDSEGRVKEIVEAVRRELAWNNKTAGRTI